MESSRKRLLLALIFVTVAATSVIRLTAKKQGTEVPISTQVRAQTATIPYSLEEKPPVVLDSITSCQPKESTSYENIRIRENIFKAQTFVPLESGFLRGVEIVGSNHSSETAVSLYESTIDQQAQLILEKKLGSITIFCGTYFEFAQGLFVEKGKQYALVVSGRNNGAYLWNYQNRGGSACAGSSYTSTDWGWTWNKGDVEDFNFKLYYAQTGEPSEDFYDDSSIKIKPTIPDRSTKPSYQQKKSSCSKIPLQEGTKKIPTIIILIPDESGDKPKINLFALTEQVMSLLEEASVFQGYKHPENKPYFDYSIYKNMIYKLERKPKKQENGFYDIKEIYDSLGICERVKSGEIGEVWLWEAGKGGWDEFVKNGPEYKNGTSDSKPQSNMPNCGKHLTTMILNYNTGPNNALHSFAHRVDDTLQVYFPCLFDNKQCGDLDQSTATSFNRRPSEKNNIIAGCGTIHHPPNVIRKPGDTDDVGHTNGDYTYDSKEKVKSYCEGWTGDPTRSELKEVNCLTWGSCDADFPDIMDDARYYIWRLQNLPGYNNGLTDSNGNNITNFLEYIFGLPQPKNIDTESVNNCSIKIKASLEECSDRTCSAISPLRIDLLPNNPYPWALSDHFMYEGLPFTYVSNEQKTTASYERRQAPRDRKNDVPIATCGLSQGISGENPINSNVIKAQTFRVGKSKLNTILLPGGFSGSGTATLTLKEEKDFTEKDQSNEIGHVSITSGNIFDFISQNITFDPQKTYAMILTFSGDGSYIWAYSGENQCTPYGSSWTYDSFNQRWSKDSVSFFYTITSTADAIHQEGYLRRSGCRDDLSINIDSTVKKGQIFIAKTTALLNAVRLPGSNNGGTTRLDVVELEGRIPTEKLIATAYLDKGSTFDFTSSDAVLEENKRYALLVSHEGGGEYIWRYKPDRSCHGNIGYSLTFDHDKQRWSINPSDFYFTVFGQNPQAIEGDYIVGKDLSSQLIFDKDSYTIVDSSVEKCDWNGKNPKPQYIVNQNYCSPDEKTDDYRINGLTIQCNMNYELKWRLLKQATSEANLIVKKLNKRSADINQDGVINTFDLNIVLDFYGNENIDPQYDVIIDGKIDALDVSEMISLLQE